ncbi:LPXTG cell wall anchor domain-containing protein [Enterococcus faecalis]
MKSKIILGGLLLSTAALVSLQSPQITSAESLTNSAEIIVPLSLKVKAHYTNGLALEAGKEVRLRNLTDGSTEVLKKQVDANGEVVFTEQDGMKKEVNYGIETDGVRNGYTVRYDLGGEKEKDITVNLPGAELPLSLKVKAHYTNGLALEAGKEVRLRNLTDGSTEVLKKQVDANGEVVFTEQDGMKKEVNYGIETDGVRNGYTVRYDLGGEKEKDITVNLPGVTKNTNSKQSSDSKASDKQANSNHPSIFFNNKKKLSNLNYNNSNEKRKLTNQEKKKEDNRNKNTMELPKTGEKYNGLSMYLGLFTVIVSIIGLKKNKF